MRTAFLFVAMSLFLLTACTSTQSGSKSASKSSNKEKEVEIDTKTSKINWTGIKSEGKHSGTVAIKSGTVKLKGNELMGGTFVIDMTSINNTDMQGGMKTNLENHLKAADFFKASDFPEATFTITQIDKSDNAESPYLVTGTAKIREAEQTIKIPATIKVVDGKMEAKTPTFVIPRILWDAVFEVNMDDIVIEDGIKLSIELKSK